MALFEVKDVKGTSWAPVNLGNVGQFSVQHSITELTHIPQVTCILVPGRTRVMQNEH